MRKNRIIWFVLFVISIVGISFYGGGVTYGFFYTMLFVPVISLLYILYVIIFFRIYQYNDGKTFVVDNPVPYSFRLINEYHLPFVGIRVKFFSPFSTINELNDETEYELMPNTGISRETTIVCHYRGEYEIGIKQVEVCDFFRLFRITYRNRECKRAIVYPKLVFINNPGNFEMHSIDASCNQSKVDVVTREYVLGDDVRFINWSQTARTGNLMTRDRIGEEGSGISVIMDDCRYYDDPCRYLPSENKIMELTIALCMYFCNRGIGSEVHYFNHQLVSVGVDNKSQFETLYNQLANIYFDESFTQRLLFEELSNRNKLLHSTVVYMVLSGFTDYSLRTIDSLVKKNIYTVVYIIGDNEIEKPLLLREDYVKIVCISPEANLEEVRL